MASSHINSLSEVNDSSTEGIKLRCDLGNNLTGGGLHEVKAIKIASQDLSGNNTV